MLAVVREAVKNDNYCNHVANICNMRPYRRLTAASSTETATPFSMKTGQARTEAEVAKRAGSAIQEKENPWGYWGCRAPILGMVCISILSTEGDLSRRPRPKEPHAGSKMSRSRLRHIDSRVWRQSLNQDTFATSHVN